MAPWSCGPSEDLHQCKGDSPERRFRQGRSFSRHQPSRPADPHRNEWRGVVPLCPDPLTNVARCGPEAGPLSSAALRDSTRTQVQVGFRFDPFAILKGTAASSNARDFAPRLAGLPGYKARRRASISRHIARGVTAQRSAPARRRVFVRHRSALLCADRDDGLF